MLKCWVLAFHSSIALFPSSATYTLPELSTAIPAGLFRPVASVGNGWVATYVLPAWVTVSVSPAMVSVPVRVAPVSASNVKVARPVPLPAAVVWSHEALLVAVYALALATMSASLPAAGPSRRAVVPRAASVLNVLTAV